MYEVALSSKPPTTATTAILQPHNPTTPPPQPQPTTTQPHNPTPLPRPNPPQHPPTQPHNPTTTPPQLHPHRALYPWAQVPGLPNDFFLHAGQDGLGVGGSGHWAIWLDEVRAWGGGGRGLGFRVGGLRAGADRRASGFGGSGGGVRFHGATGSRFGLGRSLQSGAVVASKGAQLLNPPRTAPPYPANPPGAAEGQQRRVRHVCEPLPRLLGGV